MVKMLDELRHMGHNPCLHGNNDANECSNEAWLCYVLHVQWACRQGGWEGRRSALWKCSNLKGGHMDSGGQEAAGHFVCMS